MRDLRDRLGPILVLVALALLGVVLFRSCEATAEELVGASSKAGASQPSPGLEATQEKLILTTRRLELAEQSNDMLAQRLGEIEFEAEASRQALAVAQESLEAYDREIEEHAKADRRRVAAHWMAHGLLAGAVAVVLILYFHE